jgi:hypothetical protein
VSGFSIYWICWLLFTTASFLAPELYAIATRRFSDTLSHNVWSFFGDDPNESPLTWTFVHLTVGGCLLVFFIWLAGHLVFGLWR